MTDVHAERVAADGATIGALCRAGFDTQVRSCPDWTGGDLLAHTTRFARWLAGGLADLDRDPNTPLPEVAPADAEASWDADLARLVELLGSTDPRTPVPNWSVSPHVAAFWIRRSAHEFAIHRWDAATTLLAEPDPVPAAAAEDGIAEYLDEFVGTALTRGWYPAAEATLRVELTDCGHVIARDLPEPGPVTVLRGSAPELFLAVWRRRDPLEFFVSGDRARIEAWPTV